MPITDYQSLINALGKYSPDFLKKDDGSSDEPQPSPGPMPTPDASSVPSVDDRFEAAKKNFVDMQAKPVDNNSPLLDNLRGQSSIAQMDTSGDTQTHIEPPPPGMGDVKMADRNADKPAMSNSDLLSMLRNQSEGVNGPAPGAESLPVEGPIDLASLNSSNASKQPAPIPEVNAPKEKSLPLIDFAGMDTQGTVANLRDAQAQRDQEKLAAGVMSGLDRIGAGIIGHGAQPVMQEHYAQQIKDADHFVNDFKAQVEQEKSDPSSSVSKGFRNYMKQLGIQVTDNVTAEQAEKIMPMAWKVFNDKYEATFKEKMLKEQIEARKAHDIQSQQFIGGQSEQNRLLKLQLGNQQADAKKTAQQSRDDEKTSKRFDDTSKLITSELASSRSSFGVDARTIQAVENAKALFDGQKSLNDLDNRQVYEVAKVLDRTLSQGQPSISGAAHFTPETANSWIQGKLESLTNKRRGTNLGSFIQSMKDTLDREGQIAKERAKKTATKLLSGRIDLRKKDPEKWALMMKQNDLPEDLFGQDEVTKSDVSNGQDSQIQKYADDHFGGDYAKADAFLKHRNGL